MMRRVVVLLPLLLVFSATTTACGSDGHTIVVSDLRIPAPPSPDVANAYMTIRNTASESDTLLSATSDASQSAEVHLTMHVGAQERMMPTGPLIIKSGRTLRLAPSDRHLMLNRLTRTLRVGDHVEVTLQFLHAGTIRLTVPVVAFS